MGTRRGFERGHCFSFPESYIERHGLTSWPAFLDDFVKHWPADQSDVWIESVRSGDMHRRGGPRNDARVGKTSEFRICERWTSSAKSVFQFDVQGSVAHSSHAGIPWLKRLRDEAGDRIHFWPFDGWEPAPGKSVVVEIYPSMFRKRFPSEGRTADEQDAYSVACWMAQMSERGVLARYLAPPLKEMILSSDELPPVWPHPDGNLRGHGLLPLYEAIPLAAQDDPDFYALLALFDALRIGQARERELAAKLLQERIR